MAEAVAALRVAGLLLSPIIAKLADKVSAYFGGDVTAEKLQGLKTSILPKIQTVIQAAEMIPLDQLRPWLMELKAAANEAEDVLDEYEYYEYRRLRDQVSGLASSLRPITQPLHRLGNRAMMCMAPIVPKTKLSKSVFRLGKVAAGVDEFIELLRLHSDLRNNPNNGGGTLPNPSTSSSPSAVFGRDSERDSLVSLLVSVCDEPESGNRDWSIPVHAVCGMGGAGKTALAQCVYNDKKILEHFDVRMWVHVSRKFDVPTVTMEMIESAIKGECFRVGNLDTLQNELKKSLSARKFLLVLDDVWCDGPAERIQWDQLLVPLNEAGDKGSRILITTRMEVVASVLGAKSIVTLKELESKDCMSIIKLYALGDSRKAIDDAELAEVAEQIVCKLKNSPLAAKMVGVQLGRKVSVDAWRMTLKGDMLRSTRDVLLWSFEHLPPHLRRCFVFCTLYPKGWYFTSDDLMNLFYLWNIEGSIEPHGRSELTTVEEIGRQYFDDLLSYSFFQPHPTYCNCYVIHDLLHDLADEISKDEFFRVEGDEPRNIPSSVIHLSVVSDKLAPHASNISALVNLRTFIIISCVELDNMISDVNQMFEKLTRLRVLRLESCPPMEFLNYAGHLRHLRYLQISGITKLPKSICMLYHLQYLDLSQCEIDYVPEGLNNLINLQCLDADSETISMLPDFGKLTSLQKLEVYRANKKRGCGIQQLKNLKQLRGSLQIVELENVKDKAEAAEATLKNKNHLNELILQWSNPSEEDDRGSAEILEALKPPPSLKKLQIYGYRGAIFPSWMSSSQCLSNLQTLNMFGCSNWQILPPLGQLQLLSNLQIEESAIVEVGVEFYGSSNSLAFPKLKVLKVKSMQNWVQWSLIEGVQLYPCLCELEIVDCPKLIEVPCLSYNLKQLRICDCPSLVQLPSLPHSLSQLEILNCPKLLQLFPLPCSLEELQVRDCPGIGNLMSEISNDEQPQQQKQLSIKVWIRGCSVSYLKCLQKLTSLTMLGVAGCPSLTSLVLGHCLTALQFLYIEYCESLRSIDGLGSLPSLEQLLIIGCPNVAMPCIMQPDHEDGGVLLLSPSLQSFKMRNSGDLDRYLSPTCLLGLTSLSELAIEECFHLQSLPDLADLRALQRFHISDCPELSLIGNLQCLTSLQYLQVKGCPKLTKVAGESGTRILSIKCLTIDEPSLLVVLLENEGLSSLQYLQIEYCSQTVAFTPELADDFCDLTSLSELTFFNCHNLLTLPGTIERLSSLKTLVIECCPKIELLPNLPTSLDHLSIYACNPGLLMKYRLGGPLRNQIDHVQEINI